LAFLQLQSTELQQGLFSTLKLFLDAESLKLCIFFGHRPTSLWLGVTMTLFFQPEADPPLAELFIFIISPPPRIKFLFADIC